MICTTWGRISIISTPSFSILSRRILANLGVSRANGKSKSDMITIFSHFSFSISYELRRGTPESFDRVVPVHVLKVVPQTKNFSSHLWKLTRSKETQKEHDYSDLGIFFTDKSYFLPYLLFFYSSNLIFISILTLSLAWSSSGGKAHTRQLQSKLYLHQNILLSKTLYRVTSKPILSYHRPIVS